MLGEAVEQCPDDVWPDDAHSNRFWQIAYHTTFIAHMYLHPDIDVFRPWAGHQTDVGQPDGLRRTVDVNSSLPVLPEPYTRAQVLELWSICGEMVDDAVDGFDLQAQQCGFSWYQGVSKLEHQIISIRHIQHHAAQLSDRLRAAINVGVGWVGSRYREAG